MTLNNNRLSIQWGFAIGLATVPLFIEPVHNFLQGAEVFIGISAVTVFDPTVGGHVRKVLDRLAANFAALFVASTVFLPLTVAGYDDMEAHSWIPWLLYGNAVVVAYFWGYVAILYPRHITLPYVGVNASMVLYILTNGYYWRFMWRIALGNVIGVFVGAFVFRFIVPKRARDLIKSDLVQVIEKLASTLEPLVSFEAGLISSASFFEPETKKKRTSFIQKISRSFSRQMSARDNMLQLATFSRFRDDLWKQIEDVATLLAAQEPLIRPAEREYSHKAPHRFPTDEYVSLLNSIRRLFNHIISLYLLLDAQGTINSESVRLPSESFKNILSDWQRIGTLKIIDPRMEERSQGGFWATDGSESLVPRSRTESRIALQRDKTNAEDKSSRGLRRPETLNPVSSLRKSSRLVAPETLAKHGTPSEVDTSEVLYSGQEAHPRSDQGPAVHSESRKCFLIVPEYVSTPLLRGESKLLIDDADIASVPVMRWARVYGPLISCVSNNVATLITRLAGCLRDGVMSQDTWYYLGETEAALQRFGDQRDNWHRTIRELSDYLCRTPSQRVNVLKGSNTISSPTVYKSPVDSNLLLAGQLDGEGGVMSTSGANALSFTVTDSLYDEWNRRRDNSSTRGNPGTDLRNMESVDYDLLNIERKASAKASSPGGPGGVDILELTNGMLMEKWVGISMEKYVRLSKDNQAILWSSFGNIQDRLTTTYRTLLALVVELSAALRAVDSFVQASSRHS